MNGLDEAVDIIDNRVIEIHTKIRSSLLAEEIRERNEIERRAYENARQVAEADRQVKEQQRRRNEQVRDTAEADRIMNENERIEKTQELEQTIDRAKRATLEAISAAFDCEDAIEKAENYKADAELHAITAESMTHGGTGRREGEETDNAEFYKDQSKENWIKTESFLHGGTGTRENEETDNAEFYNIQSKKNSEIAKEYLTKVEKAGNDAVDKIDDALGGIMPTFIVNIETGDLEYEGGRFDFEVIDGVLEWGLSI